MRLSCLVTALVAFASACVSAQPQRPLVMFVHGRGHLDEDTAALRREWKRDLDTALTRAGLPALRDEDVRLAWYADVLDPSRDPGCPAMASDADSAGLGLFARDFISSLAGALPSSRESRDLRVILGDMLYAVDATRRCGAQRRVRLALDSAAQARRPVVVVAYSLGSLVTYGALTGTDAATRGRVRLVTVGSPLGNEEMRMLLGESGTLRLPPGVTGWDNVYDPNDGFAAPLNPLVSGVRDVELTPTTNGDPHFVKRYLRDARLGRTVGRALCAFGGYDARACAGVQDVANTRSSS